MKKELNEIRSIIRQMVNENIGDTVSGKNFTIFKKANYLKIQLTPEGKEEIQDIIDDNDGNVYAAESKISDLFEDIQGNSEYEYYDNLGNAGFGLTDAPGIVCGYNSEDEDMEEVDVYYYNDYAIKSPIEEMLKKGYVEFTKA